MITLRLIGYWNGEQASGWPDVAAFVDAGWDEDERHMVGRYLASGTVARIFMGFSVCRICGASNGSVEYSEGTYIWPSGLAHYVDQHDVRLPDEFVRHAAARLRELDAAGFDDQWWMGRQGPLGISPWTGRGL